MPLLRKHPIISIGAVLGLVVIISCLLFTPPVPPPTSEPLRQTFWTVLPPTQIAAIYNLKAPLAGWSRSSFSRPPGFVTTLRFWEDDKMCDLSTFRPVKALYIHIAPISPGRTRVDVDVLPHDPGVTCDFF
jgi:hypothetical protein